MQLMRRLVMRVRALVFGQRLDREAREEIAAHLERQVALNRDMGMTPAEARRAAVLEIGTPASLAEECRDARGLAWWDALRADVRYAFRQMRARPSFSLAAVLTIALGVGATSAVFAVVDAVLLRPLPYPDASRLYRLHEFNERANVGRTRSTVLNFLDWQQQAASFETMAGYAGTGFTLTGRGEPTFVLGQLVTPAFLDVLGVRPMLGRGVQPEESEAGRHQVVVLSHRLWQNSFGADPAVVGRTTTVNGLPYEIVGVMAPGFSFPSDDYQLWAPLVTKGTVPGAPPVNRYARYLSVVGRLGAGATPESAREELAVVGRRLATSYADTNDGVTIRMTSLTEDTVGEAGATLVLVLASVAFLLLIACINVAGLALASGSARERELGVRQAIGASRGRLVRQLATEGLVLFAVGGLAGIGLAAWVVAAFAPALPASLPRVHEIALDWRFLAFGFLLVLATGLLFSVLPAMSVARRGRVLDLAGSRDSLSASRGTARTRAALIVVQIGVAVVLLSGAALALQSFNRVRHADTGFDTAGTMTFGFVMGDVRYPTAEAMRAFLTDVTRTLDSTPGVRSAGLTTHLPLSDQNLENSVTVDGTPGEDSPIAGLRGVVGRYREAIGARLVAGRDLAESDTDGALPVVLVTEDFATRYLPGAAAVGRRVKLGDDSSDDPWRTVVGVIADIRHSALDEAPRPEVWMPYAQLPADFTTAWARGVYAAARTMADPWSSVTSLRQAMRGLDAGMPLIDLRTLDDLARTSTARRRVETAVLSVFAALALLLAAVGLFGVLAFHVAQHAQEFSIRLALGATPTGLLALVLRRGAVLLGLGLAVGLPGALLTGRAMAALLYGTAPTDPVALGGALGVIAFVTLLACVIPASRAMRIDPLAVLRNQ